MRHEPFVPMEYANEALMDVTNEFFIMLKVWLFQDQFGEKLQDLQRRYPKPDLSEIDNLMHRLMQVLKKDAKPMIKY